MRGLRIAAHTASVGLAALAAANAWAIPIPPSQALAPLQSGWPELAVRLDLRNLVGPREAGRLTEAELSSRVSATNDIWAQCGIRFAARSLLNVKASDIGAPYEPKSQADLDLIRTGFFPKGFDRAVPLMFAGIWNWYDASYGLYLRGLGWLFTNGDGSVRTIGAFLGNQHLFEPVGGTLIAHELGHSLSLRDGAPSDNLMGGGTTPKLTVPQCSQARQTAQTILHDFLL